MRSSSRKIKNLLYNEKKKKKKKDLQNDNNNNNNNKKKRGKQRQIVVPTAIGGFLFNETVAHQYEKPRKLKQETYTGGNCPCHD